MPWPDIFFKAKKRPEPETPPPFPNQPPDAPKVVEPPPLANPPAALPSSAAPAPSKPPAFGQIPRPATQPLPPPKLQAPSVSERSTRTIPVVHGVILRPPARPPTGRLTIPTPSSEPIKNIEQLMAEADPVKTLSQTGSVRMLKRLSPEAPALRPPGTPPPIRAEPVAATPTPSTTAPAPVIAPPMAVATPSPWPSFQAKGATPIESRKPELPPGIEIKKAEPIPPIEIKKPEGTPPIEMKKAEPPTPVAAAPALPPLMPVQQQRPVVRETTFMARPGGALATPSPTAPSARSAPPPLPAMLPITSIAKRKAKLADVARIVLPPKREETGPLPPLASTPAPGTPTPAPAAPAPLPPAATSVSTAPQPAPASRTSAIVPPAFPVSSAVAARLTSKPKLVLQQPFATPVTDSPFMERTPVKTTPAPAVVPVIEARESATPTDTKPAEPAPAKTPEPAATVQPSLPLDAPVPAGKPETPAPVEPPKPVAQPVNDFAPRTDFEAPKLDPSLVFDPGKMPAKPAAPASEKPQPTVESVPQVDPEAHKTTPEVLPKLDPEAHKPPPPVAAPVAPVSTELAPVAAPGTREFHLTNGEHIAGVVLSETPETVYVEHSTLGVLTIPRAEIATRLVEIILINGDRIVGNIMAETPEMLYVRHASLGMLSVPKAQRSTRVVEAILKNGDRILGEVLTETETFTVIKSATLGTVTIPHNKVSMLNRKIEQIEMKALPSAPALPDKPA